MLTLDQEKLAVLFRDFYTLTSIHICLFDEEQTEIFHYPETDSDFCSYARKDKTIADKCRRCDHYAFSKCTETGQHYSYTCHMNLTETATPLFYNDDLIGYLMIGRVKSVHSDFNDIPEESKQLMPDHAVAEELYNRLPIVSDRVINAATHILDACASYLYVTKLISIQSEGLKKRIDRYIVNNLTRDISVEELCIEFHFSRVEIYEVFKRFYQSGVAQHIRRRRLIHAKHLLAETTLSVSKIADQTGFNDYNYFSKIFKKYCGLSASDYRKTHR